MLCCECYAAMQLKIAKKQEKQSKKILKENKKDFSL